MPFTNNCDFINEMLIPKKIDEIRQQDSFLVHSAIYPMVQKHLTRLGIYNIQPLGSYELTVGEYTFDMEILFLGSQSTPSSVSLFKNILEISQFTYFWENGTTLFREVDRYYELEEFIAINNLKNHVISVEETTGMNSIGQPIKLVTFDSTSDKIRRDELFVNYGKFLRAKAYAGSYHYYVTRTFPWHRSNMFRMYSSPFRNQRIFLEIQTFLTCMRELTYTKDPHLDLIGLCSLKLAFCDELNLTEASRDLQFEIDALIERFLCRMVKKETYIQNGKFDLHRYVADTNFSFGKPTPAVHNLIYTFQHIFHCTNIYVRGFHENTVFAEFDYTLMLNDESTDLKMVRDRSNIPYTVDGQNYNKMNSKLFCDILKCRNVQRIVLDTNYQWQTEPYLTDFVGHDINWVTILLVGRNEFNFIEDFIQFLKTIPTTFTSCMELKIEEVVLTSYHIFKNFKVCNLQFHRSKITFIMLTELLDCNLKDVIIQFAECTIEDTLDTWSLLINRFDRENLKVEILEEGKTWEYLFESIANHLTKFKLNEFHFKCDFSICACKYIRQVRVTQMKFRFDEFNTRLELQNHLGEAIDLYDWKNTVDESEDDYKNFEFYQ